MCEEIHVHYMNAELLIKLTVKEVRLPAQFSSNEQSFKNFSYYTKMQMKLLASDVLHVCPIEM